MNEAKETKKKDLQKNIQKIITAQEQYSEEARSIYEYADNIQLLYWTNNNNSQYRYARFLIRLT